MKQKRIITLLLISILAVGIIGCGGSTDQISEEGDSSTNQNNSDQEQNAGQLSGKLSIWSWGAGAEKESREEAVQVFIDAHPELEVEHIVLPTADSVWDQKSTAAFAAGNAGDVMQMSPDYYGLMTKHYEDLNPYISKEDIDLNEVITEGMLDGYYRPDGKLEAMPLLANCFVFAYNKDLFDKFGVEYPTDDWTWDDFAEMAPKFISGEGTDKTYFMVNHWVLPNFALICKGGVPYSDDFKTVLVDSEEVAAGLDLIGDLIKMDAIPDDVAAENLPKEQLFVSGRAAIYPMGGFETLAINKQVGDAFKWDVVLPPKYDSTGENTNITYATGYAMNKDAKNKDASWQFLKEVAYENNEMAKATSKAGMPANKEVANSHYAELTYGNISNKKYVEGMSSSRLNIWGGALSSAGDYWTQMWESVTIGGKTATEAQQEYFPLIKKAFEELNIEN